MLDCSTHPICCNPKGNLQQHHQNIRYPGVLLQMPRFQNESIDIKIYLNDFAIFIFSRKRRAAF